MTRNELVEVLAGRASLQEASYSSGGAANVGQPALWTGRQERLAQNWRDVLVKLEALFLDVLDADETVYGECLPILKDVRTAEGESCWECLPRFRTLQDILIRQVGDHWARFATHMKELVTDMEWMCDQLAPKDDLVPEKPPKEKDDWQADQDADLAGLPKPSKTYKPANESTDERSALHPFCPSLVMASLGRAHTLSEASRKVDLSSAGDAIRLAVETYTDANVVEVNVKDGKFQLVCEWNSGIVATATFGPERFANATSDQECAEWAYDALRESTDPRESWSAARVVPILYNLIGRYHASEAIGRLQFDEAVKSLTSRVGLHESVRLSEGELHIQYTESVLTLYGYFWDWEQRYGRPFPGKAAEGGLEEEVLVERWESGHLLVNLEARTVSLMGMDGEEEVLDKETTDEDVTARLLSISQQRESYTINPAPWTDNFRASLVESGDEIAYKAALAKGLSPKDADEEAGRMEGRGPIAPPSYQGESEDDEGTCSQCGNDDEQLLNGTCGDCTKNNAQKAEAKQQISLTPTKVWHDLKKMEGSLPGAWRKRFASKSGFNVSRWGGKRWTCVIRVEDHERKGLDHKDLIQKIKVHMEKLGYQINLPTGLDSGVILVAKVLSEGWESKLVNSLQEDVSTEPDFSDTFTGHVAASDKLAEACFTVAELKKTARENPIIDMTKPDAKARLGDRVWCGPEKQIGKVTDVDSNVLICTDQMGKKYHYEDGVAESKKDWSESFQESLNAVEEASQISFDPSNHPRGPDGRFIKGKHASRSQKSAAKQAGKNRASERGHKPMTSKELDTAVAAKKDTVAGIKSTTEVPSSAKVKKPRQKKQRGGPKPFDVVPGEGPPGPKDTDLATGGVKPEQNIPDQDEKTPEGAAVEQPPDQTTGEVNPLGFSGQNNPKPFDVATGGVKPDANVPDREQKASEVTPSPVEAPPPAPAPPAPVPGEQAPAAGPEQDGPVNVTPGQDYGTGEPLAPTGAPVSPQPAAPPPDEYTPKTKADDPKIKPKPSTSDVSAYEPEVDQEFGQKEQEPPPPKRPEVPDAPGAPVDITGSPPEQEVGDETPQTSFVSPDAAPYGDKSIQQAQPPKGFEDIIEPVGPNFVQKYRRPPENIANTTDEDFVQIRDYIYNQAAQALGGNESDPATQNILKQSQRDVEDLMSAMREEAAAGGKEFAGLTDADYEGAVRGKMRDRLEKEVDRMMKTKSKQDGQEGGEDGQEGGEDGQKEKSMWEKIIGHVSSFAGFSWDMIKDMYQRYIGGAGYDDKE